MICQNVIIFVILNVNKIHDRKLLYILITIILC
jgi:hypothetical protein